MVTEELTLLSRREFRPRNTEVIRLKRYDDDSVSLDSSIARRPESEGDPITDATHEFNVAVDVVEGLIMALFAEGIINRSNVLATDSAFRTVMDKIASVYGD